MSYLVDMVRVGSRSKNELLSPCSLKNRQSRYTDTLWRAHKELQAKKEEFVVCCLPERIVENSASRLLRESCFISVSSLK